jgi:hypothetical protein
MFKLLTLTIALCTEEVSFEEIEKDVLIHLLPKDILEEVLDIHQSTSQEELVLDPDADLENLELHPEEKSVVFLNDNCNLDLKIGGIQSNSRRLESLKNLKKHVNEIINSKSRDKADRLIAVQETLRAYPQNDCVKELKSKVSAALMRSSLKPASTKPKSGPSPKKPTESKEGKITVGENTKNQGVAPNSDRTEVSATSPSKKSANSVIQQFQKFSDRCYEDLDKHALNPIQTEAEFTKRNSLYESWSKRLDEIKSDFTELSQSTKLGSPSSFLKKHAQLQKKIAEALRDMQISEAPVSSQKLLTYDAVRDGSAEVLHSILVFGIADIQSSYSHLKSLEVQNVSRKLIIEDLYEVYADFELDKSEVDVPVTVLELLESLEDFLMRYDEELSVFLQEGNFSDEDFTFKFEHLEFNANIPIETQKQIVHVLVILETRTMRLFDLLDLLVSCSQAARQKPEITDFSDNVDQIAIVYDLGMKIFSQYRAAWYTHLLYSAKIQVNFIPDDRVVESWIERIRAHYFEETPKYPEDTGYWANLAMTSKYINLSFFHYLISFNFRGELTPNERKLIELVRSWFQQDRDYSSILHNLPVYDLNMICKDLVKESQLNKIIIEGNPKKVKNTIKQLQGMMTILTHAAVYFVLLPNGVEIKGKLDKLMNYKRLLRLD